MFKLPHLPLSKCGNEIKIHDFFDFLCRDLVTIQIPNLSQIPRVFYQLVRNLYRMGNHRNPQQ